MTLPNREIGEVGAPTTREIGTFVNPKLSNREIDLNFPIELVSLFRTSSCLGCNRPHRVFFPQSTNLLAFCLAQLPELLHSLLALAGSPTLLNMGKASRDKRVRCAPTVSASKTLQNRSSILTLSCNLLRISTIAEPRKKDGARARRLSYCKLTRNSTSSRVRERSQIEPPRFPSSGLQLTICKLTSDYGIHIVGVKNSVDLCAAPGSWSQVLSKKLWEPSDKCVFLSSSSLRHPSTSLTFFHLLT